MKTFKELFANTDIKPTTDENGNTIYSFKATLKEESKQETIEEAFSNYVNEKYYSPTQGSTPDLESAKFGAKWQQEQYGWKTVYEEIPPSNIELLVQSPEGIIHISSWRESCGVFSCQSKSESSYNFK